MLINNYFTWTLVILVDAQGLHSRIPSCLGALKRQDGDGTSVTDLQANDYITCIFYFENIESFYLSFTLVQSSILNINQNLSM